MIIVMIIWKADHLDISRWGYVSWDIPGYPWISCIYGKKWHFRFSNLSLRVIFKFQWLNMHAYIRVSHTPYIVSCSQNWKKLCADHSLCQLGMYQPEYILVYPGTFRYIPWLHINFESSFSYLRAFLSWLNLHAHIFHAYSIVSCNQKWKTQSADHLLDVASTQSVHSSKVSAAKREAWILALAELELVRDCLSYSPEIMG